MFRKVAPGNYTLTHMNYASLGNGGSIGFALKGVSISVKPGEKQTVTFGGNGRPVIGKITMPPELEKIFANNSSQRVVINTTLPLQLQPPEIPEELQAELKKIQEEAEKIKDDPVKLEELQKTFLATESGKKIQAIFDDYSKIAAQMQEEWREKHRVVMETSHSGVIEKDGTFRVEDVPAGDWTLRVDLYDYDAGHKNLGSSQPLDFTIPVIPGGRSDVTFDVGTIEVQ